MLAFDSEHQVLRTIENSTEQLVSTLQRLIQFPSVNPPGNEREHQEFLAAELRSLGLETKLVEKEPGRPNLIAILRGTGGGANLLHYAGHADVVSAGDPGDWLHPPFAGEVHDGWIWGRGSVDHKAPIAASLQAVRAIVASGVRLRGDLIFLVPVDEERGSRAGTRFLIQQGLLYGDMGIYASAGFLNEILISCSGTLTFEIRVKGQSSHSGYPRAGVNAIEKAGKLALALQGMTFDKVNPFWSPGDLDRLKPTRTGTLTVTQIAGGEGFNVVPDECIVRGSRRLIPTETLEEAKGQINELLALLSGADPEFIAEVKFLDGVHGMNTPADSPIVRIVQESVKDLGFEPKLGGSSGGFDARWIVDALAIPMVSYGAGWNGPDGKLCIHSAGECITIEDLVGMAKGFGLIIMRACQRAA